MSTIDTSNILVYIIIHNAITLNVINSKEVPLRLDMDDTFIGVQCSGTKVTKIIDILKLNSCNYFFWTVIFFKFYKSTSVHIVSIQNQFVLPSLTLPS